MTSFHCNSRRWSGFTLVELAMVLFIISLVVGGLLVPLATQMEARQRVEAQAMLEEIRMALIGYAILHNNKLPCYTTDLDPSSPDYGEEDSPCAPATLTTDPSPCALDPATDPPCTRIDGVLPWRTLGMTSGLDPWNNPWRYRVDENFVNSEFSLSTSSASNGISILEFNTATGLPDIQLTSITERPVAIIYSTGANRLEDGLNASYEPAPANSPTYEAGPVSNFDRDGSGDVEEELLDRSKREAFDDIVIWITRPFLFARMVSAGTLP